MEDHPFWESTSSEHTSVISQKGSLSNYNDFLQNIRSLFMSTDAYILIRMLGSQMRQCKGFILSAVHRCILLSFILFPWKQTLATRQHCWKKHERVTLKASCRFWVPPVVPPSCHTYRRLTYLYSTLSHWPWASLALVGVKMPLGCRHWNYCWSQRKHPHSGWIYRRWHWWYLSGGGTPKPG